MTKILIDRFTVEQVLEALEWHYRQGHSNTLGGLRLKIDEKALRNLKAALAEPQEPDDEPTYCSTCGEEDGGTTCGMPDCGLRCGAEPVQEPCNKSCAPGYCYCEPEQKSEPQTTKETNT